MRIRSIRYKSNNSNSSGQLHFHSYGCTTQGSDSSQMINPMKVGKLFPQYRANVQEDKGQEQMKLQKYKLQSDNSKPKLTSIKSQKLYLKGNSLYQPVSKSNFISKDKQNQTLILQLKNKSMSRCFENTLRLNPLTHNMPKTKLKISNFNEIADMKYFPSKFNSKADPNEETQTDKDQIILGQNLTYQLQKLQNQLAQIEDQAKKQIKQIDKMMSQISLFRPRIQLQLDNIVKDFIKGIQCLNNQLTRNKAENCTVILNWKGVINQKVEQNNEQAITIQELYSRVVQMQENINGEKPEQNSILQKNQQLN